MATDFRVSQSTLESLTQETPALQNSQSVIEALISPSPTLFNSQATIEVLTGVPTPSDLVKKITFTKSPTTGTQTVSGVPFRGVALLIWSDCQAAPGLGNGAWMANGMTDGTTQACRHIVHPGSQGTTTSAQSERTDCLVFITDASSALGPPPPTLLARAVFQEWTDDGFILNWTTNNGDPTIFHALVIGHIQAKVTTTKMNLGAGNTFPVTGVGFTPESFIVLGGAADEFGTGDYSIGQPFGSIHGFGFSNVTQNMCGWTLAMGGATATNARRGQHTDRVASIRIANQAGAADACSLRISAIGIDGYTIARMTDLAGGFPFTLHQPVQHVMALRGAAFAMGAFNTPAAPGLLTLPTTGTPVAAVLQTDHRPAGEGVNLGLAIGAWESTAQGGTWIGGLDAVTPSVYGRANYTASTLRSYVPVAGGVGSTLEVDATVVGVADGEVTLSFAAVPATPVQILYLTIAPGLPLQITPKVKQWFTGVEGGTLAEFDIGAADFLAIDDRRTALGGRWYIKNLQRGGSAVVRRLSRTIALTGATATPTTRVLGRLACHVRVLQAPFAGQTAWASLLSFDDPAAGVRAFLDVSTDYTLRHGFATDRGTAGFQALPGEAFFVRWEVSYLATSTTSVSSWLRIYNRAGLSLLYEETRSLSLTPSSVRLGHPSIGSTDSQTCSLDADFDNLWIGLAELDTGIVDSVPFPAEIFVQPMVPTGQAAGSSWTGDWRGLRDYPLSADGAQTSSTANAVTDLTHEPGAAFGLADGKTVIITVPTTEYVHKNLYDGSIQPPADFIAYPWAGASQMVGLRGLYGTCIKVRDGKRYESWLTPVHGVDASPNPYNIWARAMAHMPTDGAPQDFNRCYYFNCGLENSPSGWFNPHVRYQNLRSLVPDTTRVVARFKEGTWSLSDPNRWLGTPPGAPGPPTHEAWFFGDDDGVDYLETRTGSTEYPVADPLTISAVKVCTFVKQSSGTSIQKLRIGTTEYDLSVGAAYPTDPQSTIEWTTRTLAQIDALTYGIRSTGTEAKTLGNIWGEFLCDGELSAAAPIVASYSHKVESYTGDGTYRTLAIGFQPDAILILKVSGGTSTSGAFRSWYQAAPHTPGIIGFDFNGLAIQGFVPTGVELGPVAPTNESGASYVYLAIRDGGHQDGGSLLLPDWAARNFSAAAQAYRRRRLTPAFNTPGYLPDFLWGLHGSTSNALAVIEGDNVQFASTTNPVSNGIVTVSADPPAFDYGDTLIGVSTLRQDLLVYRRDTWIAQHFDRGEIFGVGGTFHVTGLPFTPALVVVVDAAGNAYWRTTLHTGALSTPWGSSTPVADRITAILDHGFSVSGALVGVSERAWWFAWDPYALAPPPGTFGDDDTLVNPYPGEGVLCAGGGLKIQAGPPPGSHGCTSC